MCVCLYIPIINTGRVMVAVVFVRVLSHISLLERMFVMKMLSCRSKILSLQSNGTSCIVGVPAIFSLQNCTHELLNNF